jgi:hypothetical protein
LRQPVYAVVSTLEGGDTLKEFVGGVSGAKNLHVLVFGTDDLSAIADGAPTYVEQSVREAFASTAIRGRLLPSMRTISAESAREIFDVIVRANLDATRAMRPMLRNEPISQSSKA